MLGEQLGKKFMYGSLVEVNAQYNYEGACAWNIALIYMYI